jgi:uncharacterized membrane protein
MILHPYIVNLSLWILFIGIFMEIMGNVLTNTNYRKWGGYCLNFGTVGLLLAVFSGLQAFSYIEIPKEALPAVQAHRFSGFSTLTVAIVVLALRFWISFPAQEAFLKWVYVGSLIILSVLLFRTASMGGNMAYKYQLRQSEAVEKPKLQKPSFE